MQNAECRNAIERVLNFAFCILHFAFSPRRGARMPLMLVGLNHRTAPGGVRERLSMDERKMDELLQSLLACGPLHGVAMLSTCNRVEAILSAPNEDVIEQIVDWMAQRAGAARVELEK